MTGGRLEDVLDLIDRANARDPRTVADDKGQARPGELVYGERMSAMLAKFCTKPSEHLQIAVRAQHIERWTSPRSSYPEGRGGYLKWRTDLRQYHAKRAGELMLQAGYGHNDVKRVTEIIEKRGLKRDAEVQMLEDIACLTFLKYYAGDFIAPHDDDKVTDILAKTARKMSQDGIAYASRLQLPHRLTHLLTSALSVSSKSA